MQAKEHPLFLQIQADVAEANRKEDLERQAAAMDAQQLRQQQGQLLNREYLAAVERYEAKRKEFHKVAGDLWLANQNYARLTSQNAPSFLEAVFMQIDTPSMVPPAGPWATMSSGFGTVRAAVAGWFASGGKSWV